MLALLDNSKTNTQSALSSLLKGDNTKVQGDSKFSSLLSLLVLPDADNAKPIIQNGLQALPRESSQEPIKESSSLSVKSPLLQLLSQESGIQLSDDKEVSKQEVPLSKEEHTPLAQNKNIIQLINSAKEYLKEKIDTKAKEIGVNIETKPKTLKGLVNLAKELGINIEKISLKEITSNKASAQTIPQVSDVSTTLASSTKNSEQKLPILPQIRATNSTTKTVETSTITPNIKEIPILGTPSTQEIVQVKATQQTVAIEDKKSQDTPKSKPLEALLKANKMLPLEDKPATQTSPIKASEVLSSLLHVSSSTKETTSSNAPSKSERSISDVKTDVESKSPLLSAQSKEAELTLKVREAKQLVTHFTSEIKDEIKNYKPPFVRLKMQLNPAKFGEVDVTLIQRGNNVHININSNTAAITTLMQNVQELKTQFNANGLSNTTMNFQSGSNEQQQQQNQQQRQQEIKEAYEKFNSSDEYESIATSLEIIVPRYI